jgi:hypothetical protein
MATISKMLVSSTLALLILLKNVTAIPHITRRSWTIGQSVKTTSGTVSGREAYWPANSGVSEYLGIPYGQNPIGKLRFAAPVQFKGSGKIDGTKWVRQAL